MLTHAQLSKQASNDHYIRAVKLGLEGCMRTKKEVAALYRSQPPHKKKKQKNTKRVTKKKLQAVNALGFSLNIVVNGFIRILREHCLNVSLDLRDLPTNTPLTKPPRKFGMDAWTLSFLRDKAHANFAGLRFLSTYTAISERAKSQCLKSALEMLAAVDNSEQERAYQQAHGVRKAACPVLKANASIPIDDKFVHFSLTRRNEVKMTAFDVALHLSVIGGKKGTLRTVIPLKSTKVLNKWLSMPGAELADGCQFTQDGVIVYVHVPVQPLLSKSVNTLFKPYRHRLLALIQDSGLNPQGSTAPIEQHQVFSLDMGIKKPMVLTNLSKVFPGEDPMHLVGVNDMAMLSQGAEFSAFFGEVWQNALLDKRLRKKWGSKAFKRATAEHRQLIEYELNRLPFERMKILVIENLTNIKKYKTNKKVLLWLVAFLVKRLTAKCTEHRVLMDFVHPAYTSQTCPLCRISKASNRVAESYKCQCPSFPVKPLDADFVGAFNVRLRFLESVKLYTNNPKKQQAPVKSTHIPRKGMAP